MDCSSVSGRYHTSISSLDRQHRMVIGDGIVHKLGEHGCFNINLKRSSTMQEL